VLLLDEPTNHLDLPAIEWLESEIKSLKSALVSSATTALPRSSTIAPVSKAENP